MRLIEPPPTEETFAGSDEFIVLGPGSWADDVSPHTICDRCRHSAAEFTADNTPMLWIRFLGQHGPLLFCPRCANPRKETRQ